MFPFARETLQRWHVEEIDSCQPTLMSHSAHLFTIFLLLFFFSWASPPHACIFQPTIHASDVPPKVLGGE